MRWRALFGIARGRIADAPVVCLMLVPGAMTVALAFQGGGSSTGVTAVAAVEMTVVLAVWLILAQRPLERASRPLVVTVGGLVALAAWAGVSSQWSVSGESAPPEVARDLLYAATVLLCGLVAGTRRRSYVLALGLAAACVTVSVAALVSRTFPRFVGHSPADASARLAYPIGYWNGLGMLAAIGAVLCLHLTLRGGGSRWIERVAAAALPLLAATLYATQSRGASLAALVGIALYLVLARPIGVTAAIVAVAPPTIGAVVVVYLTTLDGARSRLGCLGLALAACAVCAALLRAVAGTEVRLLGRRAPATARYRAAIAALAAVAVLALVWGVAHRVDHASADRTSNAGATHLFNAGSGARPEYWRVALHAARKAPFIGHGAGTFMYEFVRYRDTPRLFVRNAHSLYLETVAELGIVGLGLLLVTLSGLTVGIVRRLRTSAHDRALWIAVFAAAVVWYGHAGVDWDWELPAVSLLVFASGGAALAHQPEPERGGSRTSGRRAVLTWPLIALCIGAIAYSGRVALAAARSDAAVRALAAGDCVRAQARAHEALRWRDQSAPHLVIAWCRRNSQPESARGEMSRAVELNPNDWRLRYDFALLLALNGRNGEGEARRAATLNPLDAGVSEAARVLGAGTRASRRAYALRASLLLP